MPQCSRETLFAVRHSTNIMKTWLFVKTLYVNICYCDLKVILDLLQKINPACKTVNHEDWY